MEMEEVMKKWSVGWWQGQVLAHTFVVLVTQGTEQSKGHLEAGVRTWTGGPLRKLTSECQNVLLSVTMKLPLVDFPARPPKSPEEECLRHSQARLLGLQFRQHN